MCVQYVLAVTNGGMLCDYVNKRCYSSNTVTASSLLFLVNNVGGLVGLLGGGFAVEVDL